MSDDHDDLLRELSAALSSVAPQPDPDRRAAVIAASCEKFSRQHQETRMAIRHEDRKARRLVVTAKEGLTWMQRKLSLFLVGGTAIATSLVALVMINMSGGMSPDGRIAVSPQNLDLSVPEVTVTELAPTVQPQVAQAEVMAAAPQADQLAQTPSRSAPLAKSAPMEMALSSIQGAGAGGGGGYMANGRMIQLMDEPPFAAPAQFDRFVGEDINPVKRVAEDPVSTFSIDVDTASWSFARRMIRNGQGPSPDMVRIEEMVNYFDYGYMAPAADAEDPFATHVSVFGAPWNEDKQLVRIGIQGMEPAMEDRPPLDLVFLIDTSGSMNSPDKLGLLKKSLLLMLPELKEGDRIGMVVYAGSAGVVLEMTPATSRQEIVDALGRLNAGGSTAGAAGLQAAYNLVGKAKEEGRIGRVILATDGDFNVGLSTDDALKSFIEDRRDEGAYLSVLGFGAGNYNDALMQTLAQNGNGQAAYIDTLSEARKVLVDQLSGALYPIADDVKIQVEFNPAMVQEYRLIGYETRALAREDFNNDKVDAGEIGAGHQVTALYEITPVGSEAAEIPPLRYGDEAQEVPGLAEELGFVNLRYKNPGEQDSVLIGTPILPGDGQMDEDAGFAAAIAGFAQLMKDDRYLGDWNYADAAELANATKGDDPFGYRAEAVRLIHLMEVLDR